MRETWDTLEPYLGARRFAEVKAKLATHETDAASWRDTSVNYWREFSGRENPVDGGPLSIKITVAGVERGGFDLSANAYTRFPSRRARRRRSRRCGRSIPRRGR